MRRFVIFLMVLFLSCQSIVSAFVPGDANSNGVVGIEDAIFALQVVSGVDHEREKYKIASFNLDTFGLSKASKYPVLHAIAEIIEKYPIVALQEIRDQSTFSLEILERTIDSRGIYNYEYVLCRPLGSTAYYKEQYVFFFRVQPDISFIEKEVYIDDGSFERPPMAAKFTLAGREIVIVNIHIDPDLVLDEIQLIDDVIQHFAVVFNTNNIFVVGDFNADCSYWDESLNYGLFDANYSWIIGNELDTNLAGTDCTYDRIIQYTPGLLRVTSHGVFRFDEEMFMDYDFAKTVSDHYPIWVEVQ